MLHSRYWDEVGPVSETVDEAYALSSIGSGRFFPSAAVGGGLRPPRVLRFAVDSFCRGRSDAATLSAALDRTGAKRITLNDTRPTTSGSKPCARFGFTLVELLVAIAVIALLASLILPTLSRAMQCGRSTVCLNNLHQLGLAASLYASDAGRFPSILEWLYARDLSDLASGQLYRYLNCRQVYLCPSEPRLKPAQVQSAADHSYSINCMMCHAHDISEAITPANTMFFGEQTNLPSRLDGGLFAINGPDALPKPAFNHNRRAHMLMVDGHVRNLDERQYRELSKTADFRFPNDRRGRMGRP
jgi:prepilin-type N-terminal cleavage/methylation domain-containing protein/prepilin-type processing-associated H-X9-DG protein